MHLRFIVIVSGALANVHLGPKEDLRAAADLGPFNPQQQTDS
jgi:hypothetical protein